MSTYIEFNILKQLNDDFLRNIKTISVFGHKVSEVLIVTKDDKVIGFGENHSGILGFGHNNQVNEPKRIEELSGKRVISFVNGIKHVIGLTNAGKIYSWGQNDCSQLGNGMRDNDFHRPEMNEILINEVIVQVSCGAFYSLVLTEKNEIYAWGSNQYGEIGNESEELFQSKPFKLKAFYDGIVVSISCGYCHSLALTDKGNIFSWGDNEWGQLGIEYNDRTHNICKTKDLKITKPKIIKVKNDYKPHVFIKKICCGSRHSMLLSSDGEIYTFGDNTFGQIGNNSHCSQITPRIINSTVKHKDITSYFRYNISIALSENDIFFVWGKIGEKTMKIACQSQFKSINDIFLTYYQITHKSNEISCHLERIINLSFENQMMETQTNMNIDYLNHFSLLFSPNVIAKYTRRKQMKIEADFHQNIKLSFHYCDRDNVWPYDVLGSNALFITEENQVFAIGNNCNRFIGFDPENALNEPMIVNELCFKGIIHFTNGVNHVIAKTDKNQLYIWGSNEFGQLGNETNNDCFVPHLVEKLSDISIVDICCGGWHSLALTESGEVYAWGCNKYGQIGNESDNSYQLIPFKIVKFDDHKIIAISCGPHNSMALTDSDRVYSWGHNDCGQLGFEKIIASNKPKRIKIKNQNKIEMKIKKISCGFNHSLLLTSDGDIYGFGSNSFGQLANECFENHFIPVKIKNENKFIEIASHYCSNISTALSADGVYYVWGCFRQHIITQPKATHFDSFNTIFLNFYEISYIKTQTDITNDTLKNDILFPFEEKGIYKRNFHEFCKIAFGSFGIVSKVKNKNENEICAIKRIALNNQMKDSVLKEFKIMSQLDCNYVVKVKNYWIEDNYLLINGSENFKYFGIDSSSDHRLFNLNNDLLLHIQMELCFKSLKEIIQMINNEMNSKNLELRTQIHYYISSELLIETLECVNYLHKQNPPIIHRDLKPANILITHGINGRFVKLCDFGLAKLHERDGQSHTTGVGSFKYMAPEVLRVKKYNTKADIYSLAVVVQDLIKDFKKQIEAKPEMKIFPKYKNLSALMVLMMKDQELRPNCESILYQKNSWALSISDIENDTLLEKISNNSFSIEDNFHLFFMKKKLGILKQLQSDISARN